MRKKTFHYDFARPTVTVDGIILTIRSGRLETLLIQRAHDPYKGCWAFPGGFVDPDESLDRAIAREIEEEAGVQVPGLQFFGAFGDKGRDPRGWCVTVSYYAIVHPEALQPQAGDDASHVEWKSALRPPKLAFDHAQMLDECLKRLRIDLYQTPVACPLLPMSFSRRSLVEVYKSLDPGVPQPTVLIRRLQDAGVIEKHTGAQWRFRKQSA